MAATTSADTDGFVRDLHTRGKFGVVMHELVVDTRPLRLRLDHYPHYKRMGFSRVDPIFHTHRIGTGWTLCAAAPDGQKGGRRILVLFPDEGQYVDL